MSNSRKILSLILALCFLVAFATGCGKTEQKGATPVKSSSGKDSDTAILVVSFGTSYNDSREKTIGGIEQAIAKAYPTYEVRRAFTSQIIIDKLKKRDNISIDNVTEALDRAAADGIKHLIVQPTHLMNGKEYIDLKDELEKYKTQFEKIQLGAPLLTSDADFDKVIDAITAETKSYTDDKTLITFMGHGTEAESNKVYQELNEKLHQKGYKNYFVGTVEATPDLDDVEEYAEDNGYTKIVLQPLMVVAGDHANNDMAGSEDDSWKSTLTKEGFQVTPVLKGLGQLTSIQQIYVEHVADAMAADSLN